jgi:hypothetical protein
MRRLRLVLPSIVVCCALGAGVGTPGALAKHDKTYGAAKTACSSLPVARLKQALGLPDDATDEQVATAYAKRQRTAAKRKSARAGCLAGLKHHH